MNLHKTILIAAFSLFTINCFAQEGTITVMQDSGISRVLDLYQTFAKEKRKVDGFRIQLSSNNNRQILLDLKAHFLVLFPETPAYIEYQPPQFKLRIGDYKTRSEAETFLSEIRESFPSAFIVPDKIILEGVKW